jgi:hypothetical protein
VAASAGAHSAGRGQARVKSSKKLNKSQHFGGRTRC